MNRADDVTETELPLVSVIMPARNEARFIECSIRSVLDGDYPPDRLEVIVVDGMSEDGTTDIVRRLAAEDPRVRLVENPRRITPVAFNLGIQASTGRYIVFVGAHSTLHRDHIRRSVETALEHAEAWCVGGVHRILGETYVGRAIAAAMASPVGAGNSRYRLGNYTGYVDTASGAYWRWVFDKVGLFDEELVRNQDDEFNFRVRQAGGLIYLDSDILSDYYSRGSLAKLARQYFQYGFWRIRTVQKHGRPATPRQLAPLALVLVWIAVLVAPLVWTPLVWVLAGFAALYGLGLVAGAADVARKAGLAAAVVAPLVFVILHFGYGLGSLKGVVWFVLLRRGPASRAEDYPLSR
ncbi:MAG: glycosyltransferase family 2 protein [Acidobacteria bacterium]|nr:glycosyltransferase family 2 protein [Acidobacteriota bacterium]